jgi:hypothetical protein
VATFRATVMKIPSPEALLRIWEQGAGSHPVRRALALLDLAWPEVETGRWATASIGERDGSLLRLYEALFGGDLETVTTCPKCGERLESSFTTADIGAGSVSLSASGETMLLETRGCEVEYRLPTSEDLLEILEAPDRSSDAPLQLLRRCVIRARSDGRARAPEDLPPDTLSRLGAEIAERDPEADIRIGLDCPACLHSWSVAFDIVSYFLGELDDWAERTLAEVHTLAQAYGWSERDTLDLSPIRRQYYIEMVRA